MHKIVYLLLVISSILFFLAGCGNNNQTGPVEVKWDRNACHRCQMMLSDRNFSAQVRVFPKGKRSKVYKFDDMGCAVLWLEQQAYKDNPKTEIWVNDYKTKQWLDAKKAWFVKGEIFTVETWNTNNRISRNNGTGTLVPKTNRSRVRLLRFSQYEVKVLYSLYKFNKVIMT